jgi:hypothetical protein
MGGLYTPEDNYVANLLGALDALSGGITTLYDWSHNKNSPEHSDASVQGLKDAGMRGVFGYGNANAEWFPPNTLPTIYDDFRRVRKQHFASDDQLVTMAMASRGPASQTSLHVRMRTQTTSGAARSVMGFQPAMSGGFARTIRDGASVRCSGSSRPDRPNGSCPFTPPSTTRSTSEVHRASQPPRRKLV